MGADDQGPRAAVLPADVRWVAYGAPAYAELRRVVAAAKADDALAPVTLVVPSNLVGTIARRMLARLPRPQGGTGVAGLTVLTLDRLAELVAAPTLVAAGRRPATAPVLAAAWRRELAADARSFGPVAEHPATVHALVDAYRVLRDVSIDARSAVTATGQLSRDVVELFDRAAARLATRWYDVHDLCRTAVGVLADGAAPVARQLGAVVIFLPQDVDRSRAAVGHTLCRVTGATIVAGVSGDARGDAGVVRSVRRLVGTDVTPPPVTPPTATRVLHASDSDDEVRCVVRSVVEALRVTPAERVAVLHGAASPYARLLHEHLAAAGITVNGPGVRPTAERLLPRAFLQTLALAERGLTRAAVFGLLAGAPVRDAAGRRVPAARWERISRIAGVVGADDWEPRLDRYVDEQRARADAEQADRDDVREWLIERHLRDAEAALALRAFVGHLRVLLQRGAAASDWGTVAAWALEAFRALLGGEDQHRRLPPEERDAGVQVERILAGLAGLGAVEERADLVALRQVVELELADDLPRVGTSGTGVLVAPLSAAVGLDADRVFVVGLAEGLCPARQVEDALLPDHARAATAGELPALRERLDVQRRHLLAAFAAAPEVDASFPRGDLRRSGDRLPSRWLLPTLRALTGVPDLAVTAWEDAPSPAVVGSPSYATSVLTAEPATEQEWRQRALAAPAASAPAAEAHADPPLLLGRELLRGRHADDFTRFDGNLTAHRDTLPDPADGVLVVSPTSLESWVGCPHGYFVQRLLRVDPVEQPEELLEMSPTERGTLLHTALDRFFAWLEATGGPPGADDAWTDVQRRRLRELGEGVAAEFEARGVTGHPTMWARDRVRVLDDLAQFLDQDEHVRAGGRRRQVRSELRFGRDGSPPVEVPLGDGRSVRFAGAADRVDVTDDGALVVVDYKSGKAERFRGLGEDDPTKGGSKLQLPVYAHAARQALGRPDAAASAEYWFIGPRDRGLRLPLALTPEVSRHHAATLHVVVDGIRGGLFPANAPEDQPWAPFVPCSYCDPDGLGAKDRRMQWERKKRAPELRPYLDLVEPDAAGADAGAEGGP